MGLCWPRPAAVLWPLGSVCSRKPGASGWFGSEVSPPASAAIHGGASVSKLPVLTEGGPGGAKRFNPMWLLAPGKQLCEIVFVQKDGEDQVGGVPHRKDTEPSHECVFGGTDCGPFPNLSLAT